MTLFTMGLLLGAEKGRSEVMIVGWIIGLVLFVMGAMSTPALAETSGPPSEKQSVHGPSQSPAPLGPVQQKQQRRGELGEPPTEASKPGQPDLYFGDWHFGGFVDMAYMQNFNFPENHLFRSRSTTPRVNELALNMAGIYIRKDASAQSRFGAEMLIHGGLDSKDFGFGVNLPKFDGTAALPLTHFGRANVSYLAPVGKGLTVQAGLFNSFIGYESLYAKDNFNYTRAWIADYSPYLMFGANAQYAFNEQWSGAFFIVNDYFHLQNSNSQPSYGAQVLHKPSSRWTIKETVYYGPDQANTSMQFWRLFSDTIVEWKGDDVIVAFDYQIGTQNSATAPGSPRQFYMGATLPMRWHIAGPWSVALRPEFFWDRNGFHTGAEQFVKAITATGEYRLPYKWSSAILRLEYRYDDSTGTNGGFFKGNQNVLVPGQHLVIGALIWTFDSPS